MVSVSGASGAARSSAPLAQSRGAPMSARTLPSSSSSTATSRRIVWMLKRSRVIKLASRA